MRVVKRDKDRLDYTKSGKGDTILLFVHGAFIDRTYWQSQLLEFSREYTVIAVDLAGHGRSGKDRTDWSIQAFGEDIVFLIRELDLRNVILIGHSLGGDVILEAAVQIPERIIGFIGVDNFKNAGTAMPEEIQKQIDSILYNLKLDFASTAGMFAKKALLTSETDSKIRERLLKDFTGFDKDIGLQVISSSFSYYLRERELLQELKQKLYLVNVDYFPMNEEPLKVYPAAGYEIINLHGSCHYPMIEHPAEFNSALKEIISKILTVSNG